MKIYHNLSIRVKIKSWVFVINQNVFYIKSYHYLTYKEILINQK